MKCRLHWCRETGNEFNIVSQQAFKGKDFQFRNVITALDIERQLTAKLIRSFVDPTLAAFYRIRSLAVYVTHLHIDSLFLSWGYLRIYKRFVFIVVFTKLS